MKNIGDYASECYLWVENLCVHAVPLALPEGPTSDDPERHHEDEEYGARTDGHQGLEDEASVKVDPVEGPDAPRRRVREEFAVEEHHPADEVEPEEHREGEGDVVGHLLHPDVPSFVCQFRRPNETVLPGDRVNGADHKLDWNLRYSLPRHRYPPVVRTVVDHEQLKQNISLWKIICVWFIMYIYLFIFFINNR